MTVSDPAWVSSEGFRPNAGQFPIRVERHLNSFVGHHLAGVTTVTIAARYYGLHGLIAQERERRDLDETTTIELLRRCEGLLSYVSYVHSSSEQHDRSAPTGHGHDAIVRLSASGGIDLDEAIAVGAYSRAKWGYAPPYRGAELTLKILREGKFAPGPWYDDDAVRGPLLGLLERAQGDRQVSESDAAELAEVCLCTTPTSTDGAWLAGLLSGDPSSPPGRPSVGGLLWQFGRLTARATDVAPIRGANELGDVIMYSSELATDPLLDGLVGVGRWRGALLRAESVHAWRLVWRFISSLVGGARAVPDVANDFAERMPPGSVAEFRRSLPSTVGSHGHLLPAERQLDEMPELHRWLARLMLGAQRHEELTGSEADGFAGASERRNGVWEELTPGWLALRLEREADRSMIDFARDLCLALIYRSQRVALNKSRFDPKKQEFIYPARLHVSDGIALTLFGETAPAPATRIPQYLSIGRQIALFETDDEGHLRIGANGSQLV